MQDETKARKLARNLDGAKIVHHEAPLGLVFAWFGGHGINVYSDTSGDEVHYFNVGSFAEDAATEDEIRDGIADEIREHTP